jgi:hypothetical protein
LHQTCSVTANRPSPERLGAGRRRPLGPAASQRRGRLGRLAGTVDRRPAATRQVIRPATITEPVGDVREAERAVALAEELGAQLGRLRGGGPKIRQFLSMVQLDQALTASSRRPRSGRHRTVPARLPSAACDA